MPRTKAKSGLPDPIPGEPFSLIGTLRRCRSLLTVADAASILLVTEKAVYAQINSGQIPLANVGTLDVIRIDPQAWAHILEHDNTHLLASVKAAAKARLQFAA